MYLYMYIHMESCVDSQQAPSVTRCGHYPKERGDGVHGPIVEGS